MKKKMGLFGEKKVCVCTRSYQIPSTDQITEIAPAVRNYFFWLPSNIRTMEITIFYGNLFLNISVFSMLEISHSVNTIWRYVMDYICPKENNPFARELFQKV